MNIIDKLRGSFVACLLLCSGLLPNAFAQAPPKAPKGNIFRCTQQYYSVFNNQMRLEKQVFTEFSVSGTITRQIHYLTDSLGIAVKDRQVVYHYDKSGRHLGTSWFNGENTLSWQEEFYFDPNGNKIRAEYTDYTSDQPRTSYSVYAYDLYGNQVKISNFDYQGDMLSEKGWVYNRDGDIESSYRWKYYERNGKKEKFMVSIDNKYDNLGNIMRSIIETHDGGKVTKEINTFQNNFLSERTTYENGELVNKFNASGLFGNAHARPGGELDPPFADNKPEVRVAWESNPEFDEHGRPTKTMKTADGELLSVYNFEYDDLGNLVRTTRQYNDIKLTEEVTMEYDVNGNMVAETNYSNGLAISKYVYTYEYYRK